jgi:hypothetical protein
MRITSLKDYYVVTLECCEMFAEEISRLPYLSFFAEILSDMESSVALFEIKLRIMQKILPFLKRKQIEALVDVLSRIIDLPARESIYCNNLNPLRCGLLLYQLFKDLEAEKGFSPYTCSQIRE